MKQILGERRSGSPTSERSVQDTAASVTFGIGAVRVLPVLLDRGCSPSETRTTVRDRERPGATTRTAHLDDPPGLPAVVKLRVRGRNGASEPYFRVSSTGLPPAFGG